MHYNILDAREEHAAYDFIINTGNHDNEFVDIKNQQCLKEDKVCIELEVIGGEGKA